MPRHSDSLVSAVKQAVDIVSLVGDYGFTLHRSGSKYKLLCPFHDDHHPSLDLNPERQSFKCWACGAGGDIFDFVQRIERVEFPEALRMLAERAGIAIEREPEPDAGTGPTKSDLRAVCAWALEQFELALKRSTPALRYISQRGLTPEISDQFLLGFSPDERDWLLRRASEEGIDLSALESVGLVARNDDGTLTRDRFRGRLIFPIFDWQGRPIAFGGRILPEYETAATEKGIRLAKYINSPETPLFQKRRSLYGINLAREEARKTGWVAVVEGYTDVIAAHQAGLSNVVGTLGTALGDDHVPLLRRLCERVVLVFDGDDAGQKAAERAIEVFLGHEIDARVLVLPTGVDPCDFLLNSGAEPFRAMVAASLDPLDFAIERAAARFDLGSSEGTRLSSEWILGLLARVPRNTRAGLDLKMAKALDLIGQRLRLPVNALQRRLADLRKNAQRAEARTNSSPDVQPATPEAPPTPEPAPEPEPLECEILRIILNDPALMPRAAEAIRSDQIRHPLLREIWECRLEEAGSTARLGDAARSLAAGLLLPVDPQPSSNWVPSTSWSDRLDGALRQWNERQWRETVQELELRLARTDRLTNPEEYESLRRAFLQLHHQRPDSRKTTAS